MAVGCDVCSISLRLATTLRSEIRAVDRALRPTALYGVASTVGMWGGVDGVERIEK
jgi:hypothetical protein